MLRAFHKRTRWNNDNNSRRSRHAIKFPSESWKLFNWILILSNDKKYLYLTSWFLSRLSRLCGWTICSLESGSFPWPLSLSSCFVLLLLKLLMSSLPIECTITSIKARTSLIGKPLDLAVPLFLLRVELLMLRCDISNQVCFLPI